MSHPAPTNPKKYAYIGDPLSEPPPPELMEIFDHHRGEKDALITVLEEIQHHYGYLPTKQLQYTARELGFPLARVYGVATFYNLFQLAPPGRYQVRICKGTACHVGRSDQIIAQIEEKLGVKDGETTEDKLITLQTVACVGACSLAPVVVINDRTLGRMTAEQVWAAIEALQKETSE
jgi:NADH-quinone oxidoreductase subunit E